MLLHIKLCSKCNELRTAFANAIICTYIHGCPPRSTIIWMLTKNMHSENQWVHRSLRSDLHASGNNLSA